MSFDCHSIQAKVHRDPFNSNHSLWFEFVFDFFFVDVVQFYTFDDKFS